VALSPLLGVLNSLLFSVSNIDDCFIAVLLVVYVVDMTVEVMKCE